MEQTETNAKTEETSLPSSDATQNSSSAQQDANTQQDDSTQQVDSTADTADSSDAGTGDDNQQNGQQDDTTQQTQSDDAANVVLDKQEDAKLDFHKHPRFQEVIAEKNQWRTQYESAKPLVDQATVINNILSENNIPAQEFSNALQYLIALRKDPATARAMLAPTFEKLSQFTGDRLPQDLEAEVAAGTLSKERAVEMAKYRGQQEYQQWRSQGQQQTQQTQAAEVVASTVQTVVSIMQRQDPDFKPGSELFNETEKNIKAMPLFRTPAEAQAGIDKAYKEAKTFLSKYMPRTVAAQQKRPPQNRNTANNGGGVMKTPADVVKAIQQGMKPHQMRY